MNLKELSDEALKDFLDDEGIPDSEISKIRAALSDGKEWEWCPDSIEGGNEDVYWCDDCSTWHRFWSVLGMELDSDGVLYENEHTVDSDGDWSYCDRYLYGTVDYLARFREVERNWLKYTQWALVNDQDPLGNFFPPWKENALKYLERSKEAK